MSLRISRLAVAWLKEAFGKYLILFITVWFLFIVVLMPLVIYFTHDNMLLCSGMCILTVVVGLIIAVSHVLREYEGFLSEEKEKIKLANDCRILEYGSRDKAKELIGWQERLDRVYTIKDLEKFEEDYYSFIDREHLL